MSDKVVEFRPKIKEIKSDKKVKHETEEPVGFLLELGNNTCLGGTTQTVYNEDSTVQFVVSIETEGGALEPIVSMSVLNDKLVTTVHATVSGVPQPMAIVQHLFTNIQPIKYTRVSTTPPSTKVN